MLGRGAGAGILRSRWQVEFCPLVLVKVSTVPNERFGRIESGAPRHLFRQTHVTLQSRSTHRWKIENSLFSRQASKPRQATIMFGPRLRCVFAITGENFIAAHAREKHGRIFFGLAAHQVSGNDGRVCGGFIHVPRQLWQKVGHLRFDHDFVMLATESASHALRDSRVVHGSFAHTTFFWKRNCISAHGMFFCHGSNDACRIQPGAQKRSDRNIAHHLPLDRGAEALAYFACQIFFFSLETVTRRGKLQIPILLNFKLATFPSGVMTGGKLVNSLEHGQRVGHPKKS